MKTPLHLSSLAILSLVLASCVDDSQLQAVQSQLATAESKVAALKKELTAAKSSTESLQKEISKLKEEPSSPEASTPKTFTKEEMKERWASTFKAEEYKELFDGKTPIAQLGEITIPEAQPIYTAKATLATLGGGQTPKIIEMDVHAGWDGNWILKKPADLNTTALSQQPVSPQPEGAFGSKSPGGQPPPSKSPPPTPTPGKPQRSVGPAELYDFGK